MTDISVIKMIISVVVWWIYPSWVNDKVRAWEGLGHSGMSWTRLSRDDFRSKLEIISFLSRVTAIQNISYALNFRMLGTSDLSYAWNFRAIAECCGFYNLLWIFSIYIYKTVVCDRVLTLNRPCAYPGAVLRHASGPTGPRTSSRSFSPFIKSSLPGSSKSRCSRKQTKPSLSKINNSTLKMKLFLSKGFF